MAVAGLLCWLLARRVPLAAHPRSRSAPPRSLSGLLIYESGVAAGQYGSIFVWATLVAAYFFPRRVAVAHLAWLLVVYAVTLAAVESTAGYSPLTRWLFTAVSLTRGDGADQRHRRPPRPGRPARPPLLRPLPRHALHRRPRGLLRRGQRGLGSVPRLQPARSCGRSPFVDLVHPDDRERTEAEAASLFDGVETVGFENRYRAKDGSWHWLRWSSTLAPDESLIYARATDVTELKRVESERENLLAEVEALARSDALTGLPNRRALDEQLPREMARARRAESDLCLAIVDLDHFKAYNDANGHLAGDEMLRAARSPGTRSCAAKTRSSASAARSSSSSSPTARPSRRRRSSSGCARRPRAEQTCSAGLACWDCAETRRGPGRPRRQRPLPGQGGGPRPARPVSPRIGVMMAAMGDHDLTVRFRKARRDPELTVVEGFHALKHALRFGAELVEAVAVDPERAGGSWRASWRRPRRPARRPGRDGSTPRTLADLVPLVPRTGVVAIARRPPVDVAAVLADPRAGPGGPARAAEEHGQHRRLHPGRRGGRRGRGADHRRERPLVPRRGARRRRPALRAAGDRDRGAAGERPAAAGDRPRGGGAAARRGCRARAVLAFGTERHGISAELLERADARVAIPMRAGVSSLNLATSVAVALYCQRLG